jgi:hypothetical protein
LSWLSWACNGTSGSAQRGAAASGCGGNLPASLPPHLTHVLVPLAVPLSTLPAVRFLLNLYRHQDSCHLL